MSNRSPVFVNIFVPARELANRRRTLCRLVIGAIVVSLYAAGAFAQCSATVSASVGDGGRAISFTATGVVSDTQSNWVKDIEVYIDGVYHNKSWCEDPAPNCTYSDTSVSNCRASGPHTVTAVVRCFNGSDSKSTTVTISPDAALSVTNNGSTEDGTFSGLFVYDLGRADSGVLEWWWTAPDGSPYYYKRHLPTDDHTWTVFTACWPEGSYPLTARLTTCGGDQVTRETSLNVPSHEPTVTLEPVEGSLSRFLVKWKFPHTGGRKVRVEWEPDRASIWETGLAPVPIEGEEPIDVGSCVVGSRDQIRAWALACNDMESGYAETEAAVTLPKCGVTCCKEEPATCAGDPVRVTSGNMRMSDRDPLPGAILAPLQRTYDSRRTTGVFGRGWMSAFDAWLKGTGVRSALDRVLVETEGGDRSIFVLENGAYRQVWPVVQSVPGSLVRDGSGDFLYRDGGSNLIRVFRDGKLVALRKAGADDDVTITYDANGRPTTVADSRGTWVWTVTTNTSTGRITSIAVDGLPDLQWTYTSDANGNLTTVSTTAGVWRTYTYNNGGMETARDGSGHLIESHVYDAAGQALTSSGDNGEITNIEYDLPGRAPGEWRSRVTYANGRTTDYYSRYIAGKMRTVQIDGSCDCGTEDGVFVHDAGGRLIREQDALGYIRQRQFTADRLTAETTYLAPRGCDPATDAQRCRLTQEALAATVLDPTSESRTESYEYGDQNWPDRVTRRTTDSILQTGGTKSETFVYDPSSGTAISRSVSGWTANPPLEETRTATTALYDGVAGAAFDPAGSFNAAWLTLAQPRSEPKSIDGPRSDVQDVTTFVYYPIDASVPVTLRGRLAASRNAAGHVTRFETYDVFGNATRFVDPNNVATETVYDALGRVLTTTLKGVSGCDVVLDPLCATDIMQTRVYDGSGPLSADMRAGSVTTYAYDDRGRVQAISSGPSSNDLRERIEYTFDPATGQKSLERVLAFENGSWVEKKRESYAYNTAEQLQTITHADGTSVEYTYGPGSQLLSIRDENHSSANTTYQYDVASRIKEVNQTLSTAAGGSIRTRYGYDRDGNLTSVTDPNGNVTTYRYDDFGQMLEQVSPVTAATRYVYDAAGQPLSTTIVGTSNTTTRTYDVLGRVLSSTSVLNGGEESITWTYDTGAFGISRVASMSDPTGTTQYVWNRQARLLRETRTIESAQYITGFGYDAHGNRSRITYPSGRIVDYQFDHASRPISVTSGGTTLVASAAYLPFGPLRDLVFGNGTTRTMTYDLRYRPVTNTLDGPEGKITSYAYTFDAIGNITKIDDTTISDPPEPEDSDSSFDRWYTYDDLNRLTAATGGPGLWGAGSYGYDRMGNMRSVSVGGTVQTFEMVGTTPKIASVENDGRLEAVQYDLAGNEIAVGAHTFDYSPRNHLLTTGDRSYAYDGRGARTTTSYAVTLAAFAVSETKLSPNQTVTGTVTLSAVAPIGGVKVHITSSNVAITVLPEVVVEAGQANATFSITVAPDAQSGLATLTATYATTLTAKLAIIGGPTLAAFTTNAASIVGGNPLTATVTLTEAPRSGKAVVAITSKREEVESGFITIPAGSITGSTQLSTSPVLQTVIVPLTAKYHGPSLQAVVEVRPDSTTDTLTVDPDGVLGGSSATGRISLAAPAPAGGRTFALTSGAPGVVDVPPSVQVVEGALTATFAITTSQVATATAVTITANDGSASLQSTLTVVCITGSTPVPTFPPGQTIFVDDALPAGAVLVGSMQWDQTQAASGTSSLVHAYAGSGLYRTTIVGLSEPLSESDQLFVYARVADCAVPRQILVRARTTVGDVTAYWGDPIWGVTEGGMHMGAVPPNGSWLQLDVLLRGLETGGDVTLSEIELAHVDGQVWFDRIGRMADCAPAAAEQPSAPSDEDVFIDEDTAIGVILENGSNGPLAWTSAQAASGSRSLVHPYVGLATYRTAVGG